MKSPDHHKGSAKRQTATHTGRGPHTIRATGAGDKSCRFAHTAGGIKCTVGGGTTKKSGYGPGRK